MHRNVLVSVLLCLLALPARADSPQQFASIGDLPLVSGQVLRDVRIGYRTAGTLNADRSNAVLYPTWFTGSSESLFRWGKIGPGMLADTDHYYVIAVDALGNGVSTSPSNSRQQAGRDFPAIAIDDMVAAQHLLLTQQLGIDHVHAVVGISMGGMQAFQWVGQHPDFMDKAVPIDGSPSSTSYDQLLWQTHAAAIEILLEAGVGNETIMEFLGSLNLLNLWTPDYFVDNVTPEALPAFVAESVAGYAGMDALDYLAQLQAIIGHDVVADFAGAEQPYARRVRAELLVVGVSSDLMVNPAPAKAMAATLGARYLQVTSNCGHIGSGCESWRVDPVVRAFLSAAAR